MATVEFIITSSCPCPCLRPPPTPPTSGMFLLLRFGIIIISHTRRHCRSHLVRRRCRLHNRQQLITSANVTCRPSIAYSLSVPGLVCRWCLCVVVVVSSPQQPRTTKTKHGLPSTSVGDKIALHVGRSVLLFFFGLLLGVISGCRQVEPPHYFVAEFLTDWVGSVDDFLFGSFESPDNRFDVTVHGDCCRHHRCWVPICDGPLFSNDYFAARGSVHGRSLVLLLFVLKSVFRFNCSLEVSRRRRFYLAVVVVVAASHHYLLSRGGD